MPSRPIAKTPGSYTAVTQATSPETRALSIRYIDLFPKKPVWLGHSGNILLTLVSKCEETIIPSPGGGGGAGNGGYGFFSDRFSFIDRDGAKVVPDACEYTDSGHFCTNCIFNSKYLSSPTNATGVSTSSIFPRVICVAQNTLLTRDHSATILLQACTKDAV